MPIRVFLIVLGISGFSASVLILPSNSLLPLPSFLTQYKYTPGYLENYRAYSNQLVDKEILEVAAVEVFDSMESSAVEEVVVREVETFESGYKVVGLAIFKHKLATLSLNDELYILKEGEHTKEGYVVKQISSSGVLLSNNEAEQMLFFSESDKNVMSPPVVVSDEKSESPPMDIKNQQEDFEPLTPNIVLLGSPMEVIVQEIRGNPASFSKYMSVSKEKGGFKLNPKFKGSLIFGKLNLKRGDLLTHVNGVGVYDPLVFLEFKKMKDENVHSFTILRDSKELEIEVDFGKI